MDSVKPGSSLSPFQQAEGEAGDKAAKLTEAPEASFGRRTVSPKPSEAIKTMSLSPGSDESTVPEIIHGMGSFISASLRVLEDDMLPTQDQTSCSYASHEVSGATPLSSRLPSGDSESHKMLVEEPPKRREGEGLSEPPFENLNGLVRYCEQRLNEDELLRLKGMFERKKNRMAVHKDCYQGNDSARKIYALYQLGQTQSKTFSKVATAINYHRPEDVQAINAQDVFHLLFPDVSTQELCALSITFGHDYQRLIVEKANQDTDEGKSATYWLIKSMEKNRQDSLNIASTLNGKNVPCPFSPNKWKREFVQKYVQEFLSINPSERVEDLFATLVKQKGKDADALKQIYSLANSGNEYVLRRLASLSHEHGMTASEIARHFKRHLDMPNSNRSRDWKAYNIYQLIQGQAITSECTKELSDQTRLFNKKPSSAKSEFSLSTRKRLSRKAHGIKQPASADPTSTPDQASAILTLPSSFHASHERPPKPDDPWFKGVDFSEPPFEDLNSMVQFCTQARLNDDERKQLQAICYGDTPEVKEKREKLRKLCQTDKTSEEVISACKIYTLYSFGCTKNKDFYSIARAIYPSLPEYSTKIKKLRDMLFPDPSPKELYGLGMVFFRGFLLQLSSKANQDTDDGRNATYWLLRLLCERLNLTHIPSRLNSVSKGIKVPCPFSLSWNRDNLLKYISLGSSESEHKLFEKLLRGQGRGYDEIVLSQLHWRANQGNKSVLKNLAELALNEGIDLNQIVKHFNLFLDIPGTEGKCSWQKHMIFQLIKGMEITNQPTAGFEVWLKECNQSRERLSKETPRFTLVTSIKRWHKTSEKELAASLMNPEHEIEESADPKRKRKRERSVHAIPEAAPSTSTESEPVTTTQTVPASKKSKLEQTKATVSSSGEKAALPPESTAELKGRKREREQPVDIVSEPAPSTSAEGEPVAFGSATQAVPASKKMKLERKKATVSSSDKEAGATSESDPQKKADKETILEKSIKSARGGDTAALGQLITLLQAEDKSEKQILSILKNKGLIKGLWNSHTINEHVEIFIKSETEKAEQAAKAKVEAKAKKE